METLESHFSQYDLELFSIIKHVFAGLTVRELLGELFQENKITKAPVRFI